MFDTYDERNIEMSYVSGDGEHVTVLVSAAMLDKAVTLRAKSLTYRQIAEEIGTLPAIVKLMITRGLADDKLETTDETRKIELRKLDYLEQAAHDVLDASREDGSHTRALGAIDRLLRLSETRRKLLGVDAPTVVESKPLELLLNGVDVSSL